MSCCASAEAHESGASAARLGSGIVATARASRTVVHQAAALRITGHPPVWVRKSDSVEKSDDRTTLKGAQRS